MSIPEPATELREQSAKASRPRQEKSHSGREVIAMWKFKMCPRCRGDIFIDQDTVTLYEKCLQCGYERALENIVETKKPPVKAKKERARALRT